MILYSKFAKDAGVLIQFSKLLQHHSNIIREEVCFFLSNMIANENIAVIDVTNTSCLVHRIAEQIEWATWNVKREAGSILIL